jgi:hypothetical protein
MQPTPLTDRTQQVYIPAPDLVNPYVQNLTFSVTHSVRNNMTVDVRYLGTSAGNSGTPSFRSINPII